MTAIIGHVSRFDVLQVRCQPNIDKLPALHVDIDIQQWKHNCESKDVEQKGFAGPLEYHCKNENMEARCREKLNVSCKHNKCYISSLPAGSTLCNTRAQIKVQLAGSTKSNAYAGTDK